MTFLYSSKFVRAYIIICILLDIMMPVYALSPKSFTKINKIYNKINVNEIFLTNNPVVIDLSKKAQYPNLNNRSQSILFTNLNKLVDDYKIRGFLESDATFQAESIDGSPINEKTKDLYMQLKQLMMRFQGFFLPDINLYISRQIKEFISSKGYSWWQINKRSYFDPSYIFQELFKNAIIHGNALDLSKPIFVGWEIVNNTFILRVGDNSSGILEFNDNSLFKISGSPKSPEFEKKLKVATYTMLTGQHQGVNDLQTWNEKKWEIDVEPIMANDGKIIGKYIKTSFPLQKNVKKKFPFQILETLKSFAVVFSAA